MPDYDRLWKEVISDLFEEFLLFFAPELYEKVDFSKPPQSKEQELHKLHPSSKTKNRRADKLVGCQLKNGQEQWILVHIEVQGKKEQDFSKRMFQYFYRALDKFDKNIYAIALLTDDSPTFKPSTYNYHFFGTELNYKYDAYKVLDQDENQLLQSNNPFALVILAGLYVIKGKKDNNLKYQYKRKLLRLLLKNSNLPRSKIEGLFIFIDHVIELNTDESSKLFSEIDPLIEKEEAKMSLTFENSPTIKLYKQKLREEGIAAGREEGREEGRKEGKRENSIEIARKMLKEGFSVDMIVKITELSKEEIEKL